MSYTFEDLIESVHHQPTIWQRSHPHYNNEMRKKSWSQIAKELKTNEIRLRKSWKYLVDQYRKELKVRKQYENKKEPVPSVWAYYSKMSFLKEEIITRQKRRNIRKRANSDTHSNDSTTEGAVTHESTSVTTHESTSALTHETPQQEDDETNYDTKSQNNLTSNQKITSLPIRYSCHGLSKTLNENYEHTNMHQHATKNTADTSQSKSSPRITKADLILRRLQHLNAIINDDDHMFFMSILPMVKTLSPVKKLQLRGKINEWLLQMLSGDSDPLNSDEQNFGLVNSGDNWGQASEDNKEAVIMQIMGAKAD